MSLSSLRSDLSYYNRQVAYWQNSANIYSSQIAGYDADLGDRNDQIQRARTAKGKCEEMRPANTEVKDGLRAMGQEAATAIEVGDCTSAAEKIADPIQGHIDAAVSAAQALIDKLQGEINDLNAKRGAAIEGRDYSNGRADMYRASAARTRTAIANYSED